MEEKKIELIKEIASDSRELGDFLVKLAGAICVPGKIQDFKLDAEGAFSDDNVQVSFRAHTVAEELPDPEEELKSKFLVSHDWERLEGWAINTEEMNPETYEEIFFQGETLEEAIEDYARKTSWWSFKPSDGVQIFEDIDDAIEYEEESGHSFEKFKSAMEGEK
jgi:hypothetical protein